MAYTNIHGIYYTHSGKPIIAINTPSTEHPDVVIVENTDNKNTYYYPNDETHALKRAYNNLEDKARTYIICSSGAYCENCWRPMCVKDMMLRDLCKILEIEHVYEKTHKEKPL